MKAILIPFLSLLIPLTPQSAFAQSEPELKLELLDEMDNVAREASKILG